MEWMRHFLLLHSFRGFRFFSFPFLIPEYSRDSSSANLLNWIFSLVKFHLQFPFSNLYLQLPFLGSSNLHDEIFIFLLSISFLYPSTYLFHAARISKSYRKILFAVGFVLSTEELGVHLVQLLPVLG